MDADLSRKIHHLLEKMPEEAQNRMADELGINRKHIKKFLTGPYEFSQRDMERMIRWLLEETGTLDWHINY